MRFEAERTVASTPRIQGTFCFGFQTLSLSKSGGGGDVHQGFQALLNEVNSAEARYLLRTANRLFGEKTCGFLSVSPLSPARPVRGPGARAGGSCGWRKPGRPLADLMLPRARFQFYLL